MWDIKITALVLAFTAAVTTPKVNYVSYNEIAYQKKLEEVDANTDEVIYKLALEEVRMLGKIDTLGNIIDSVQKKDRHEDPNTTIPADVDTTFGGKPQPTIL